MGIGKKSKNIGEIAEGKTKESVGRAVGNERLEGKGRVQKVKGKVKQVVEKGKDTFRH
ncbi:CsbD family protein [Streptomyces sp. NBC_00257]|uniref:CsbD family protein n=1 Tax=Streptomyces TaxID=1883 RepID=UPI000F5C0832|nr:MULTISPECIES: CsbD family protein [unclassified Streptomyces]WSG49591.1 CsbD family protein [Streptomyces sp. NBC_01732]WSW09063.1 CsbD family protein [Streptomyces sp. NBC_01005]WSX00243.1 CsbD family protein [Streptomyces sp. NBC_00987]WTB53090.1 CsbD family protein [Streptomyces sp. NBC_00826]WTC98569.1 CsbD family protein [Streptomyces sp. NBC_01650]WTH94019.1 CsbD family protein [Streptomyces sp. NBC_00825]WTI02754.1 CsbD family protein [Streptomyces sp. NBC_00822]